MPLTIDSGYISRPGLASTGVVFQNKSGGSLSIGKNSVSSYVRNVPAGTTAKGLLGKIELKSSYQGKYTLSVIDAKGKKASDSTNVTTGMMVGVYSGSTLKGTADITVNGSAINNTGANYIVKANRSLVTVRGTTGTATAAPASTKLTVDGKGGPLTVKKLQKFLGVSQTGKITVSRKMHKYNKTITSIKYGKKDNTTVKALQRWVGVKADGIWGKSTTKALQKKLGVRRTGYLNKTTMKALQKYLNAHCN